MRIIAIQEISIDGTGRLFVRPKLCNDADFALIYRAAAGIDWDADSRSLVAPKPKEWSYLDWFQNILSAVRTEYGDQLTFSSHTRWSNVPDDLRLKMEQIFIEPAT